MWEQLRETVRFREMLRNMIAKELRAKYKASVLGFVWTFINPLFMLVVYSLAFGVVLHIQQQNYAMFLFVALLPWNYMVQSIMQGAASIVQGASLVKKIYFPRTVLPLAVVFANLVNFLLSILILVPALLLFHVKLTEAVIALPAVLAVQTVMVIGLTLLVAVGNVYFRDLEHILGVLTMAWLYITPIFYGIDIIPQRFRPLFDFNPATPIIEAYRQIFFYGQWPQWAALGWWSIAMLALLLASWTFFSHAQRRLAEEL